MQKKNYPIFSFLEELNELLNKVEASTKSALGMESGAESSSNPTQTKTNRRDLSKALPPSMTNHEFLQRIQANQTHKKNNYNSLHNDKGANTPHAECPNFFDQHLKIATNFFTETAFFFESCINNRKSSHMKSPSNKNSVEQNTATVPTQNKTPGTAPAPKYPIIGPINKTPDFYKDIPPATRS